MANKKIKQNSIIEPTEEEIKLFQELIQDMPDKQMDSYSNEYFDKVKNEEINISFARFVIDKLVRPIQPGDTISYEDDKNEVHHLFCLIRKEIEGTSYLLFSKVDGETEELITEYTYLFYVHEIDEKGFEVIDLMPNGEETERVLDLMEEDVNVEFIDSENTPKEE